jgi:effector-binding domain-containing protein
MRLVSVFLLAAAMVAVLAIAAFGDEPASPQNDQAGAGTATAQAAEPGGAMALVQAAQALPLVPPSCPMCVKAGGLCPACEAVDREFLAEMTSAMYGDCTPDHLSAKCQEMVDASIVAVRTLKVHMPTEPALPVGYLEGKVSDDMSAGIGQMLAEGGKQGLMNENTLIGTVYPDVMANGYHEDTVVHYYLSLPEGATPQAPLKSEVLPAGEYMVVEHWGDYANLGASWMASLAFAHCYGFQLGTGTAGEAYLTNPDTTPMEEWLTLVYIPLAPPAEAEAPAAETQG